MNFRILGAVLVAVMFLPACTAGVNFVKPADNQLVLGSTTKDQVLALMGKPDGKGQKVANGEELDLINYAYAQLGGEAAFSGITPGRAVGFLFHKNILIGKEFVSSFKSDSTYFDVEKAKSIKQGMTSQEVTALLGKADGEYLYPFISRKNGRGISYIFTQTKGFKSQRNLLSVELDENETVQKSEFIQFGDLKE